MHARGIFAGSVQKFLTFCSNGGKKLDVTKETIYFYFFLLQSVYNLLGETLSRLQQYAEAERWFQASLASQPDHVPAHITYGKLLARNVSSRRFAFRSPSPAIAALFHLIAIYFPSLTISTVTT